MKDGVGDCVVNDIAVDMEHEHTRFEGWLHPQYYFVFTSNIEHLDTPST